MPVNAPRTTTIGTMPCPLSGITVSTMNSRGKVSQASTNRCTTKSNVPLQQPDSRPKKRAIDQADGNGYQGPGAATTGLQPPQGARNDARIRRGHTTNGVPCCWRTCAVARPVAGSLPDPRGVQSEHVRRCHARPARPAAAGWWGPPGCRCRQVGLTNKARLRRRRWARASARAAVQPSRQGEVRRIGPRCLRARSPRRRQPSASAPPRRPVGAYQSQRGLEVLDADRRPRRDTAPAAGRRREVRSRASTGFPRVGAVDRVAALARECTVSGSANADDASRPPPAQ